MRRVTGHGSANSPRRREYSSAVVPVQLISEPTPLPSGAPSLSCIHAGRGDHDALMVHLPASGVLFAGDVMMPYLGQPFANEGSPEGLLKTVAFIGSLRPRLLIHGHATLTELFTAEAVAGLEAALAQLHGEVLDGIRDGRPLRTSWQEASLPALLRDHPTAVVPYLVIRDHFTERLYHQHTGYWQPDGRGLEQADDRGRARRRTRPAGRRQRRAVHRRRRHPHRPRRLRPRPGDHPAGPAALPRQHPTDRAAPRRAAPPHGAAPAVRPVQVPHLRRARRRDRPGRVAAAPARWPGSGGI